MANTRTREETARLREVRLAIIVEMVKEYAAANKPLSARQIGERLGIGQRHGWSWAERAISAGVIERVKVGYGQGLRVVATGETTAPTRQTSGKSRAERYRVAIEAIAAFHGQPTPTYEQLGAAIGYSATSVYKVLQAALRAGVVVREIDPERGYLLRVPSRGLSTTGSKMLGSIMRVAGVVDAPETNALPARGAIG